MSVGGQLNRLKLLASASGLALFAVPGVPSAQDQVDAPESDNIIVKGSRLDPYDLEDATPLYELNESDLALYGFSTIGELLDEVTRAIDRNGGGPVVLINGQLSNGLQDISDLPTEAVERLEVLPNNVAARFGQSPARQVVNVIIKPDLTQVTLETSGKISTRGDALEGKADANLLKLVDTNRRSIVFRARRGNGLLEADRSIRPDPARTPFSLLGNVFAASGLGNEIDPALSSIAGRTITVAGIPAEGGPYALGAFATAPNSIEEGFARSLLDETTELTVNANFTQRYGPNTSISVTGGAEYQEAGSLLGLSPFLATVPASSPFSPITRDVSVAYLAGEALQRERTVAAANVSATANGRLGNFAVLGSAAFSHRVTTTESGIPADFGDLASGILAGDIDPFDPLAVDAAARFRTAQSRFAADILNGQVALNGPIARLPSGDVRLSLRIGAALDRSKSESDSTGTLLVRRFRRDELTSQANLNLPMPSIGLGEISADLTAGYRTHSDAGSLENYGTALNWNPIAGLSLRASFTLDELPTLANLLNDPIVLTQNVRAYDFLRQETVLVTLLTGGNPDLLPQQRKSSKLELTYSASRTLSLNAEYNHIVTINAVAALPPASAETQSAFPDRYIRDPAGRLVRLDARAIGFQRDQVDAVTWGVDFRHTFRGSGTAPDAASAPDAGLRMALRADHTWFLTSTRRARPGLDAIDLLDGGALGYGGGQTRHLVRTSLAFNYQGVGLQVFGNWDSGSKVNSGPIASPDVTIFSPRLLLDLRLFVNLSPRFPGREFARNARLSLEVENLLDSRLRVYDQNGITPIRYQPFLLDPIGRSVKLTLRKAF